MHSRGDWPPVGAQILVSFALAKRQNASSVDVPHEIFHFPISAFDVLGSGVELTRIGEPIMKDSTKDQVQGKLHETKGKIKEQAGKLTNNPNLEADGQDEKVAGKIQKKVGQIEKVLEK